MLKIQPVLNRLHCSAIFLYRIRFRNKPVHKRLYCPDIVRITEQFVSISRKPFLYLINRHVRVRKDTDSSTVFKWHSVSKKLQLGQ